MVNSRLVNSDEQNRPHPGKLRRTATRASGQLFHAPRLQIRPPGRPTSGRDDLRVQGLQSTRPGPAGCNLCAGLLPAHVVRQLAELDLALLDGPCSPDTPLRTPHLGPHERSHPARHLSRGLQCAVAWQRDRRRAILSPDAHKRASAALGDRKVLPKQPLQRIGGAERRICTGTVKELGRLEGFNAARPGPTVPSLIPAAVCDRYSPLLQRSTS